MPTPATTIDTRKVTGRRTLNFSTLAEMGADADQLAAAEHAGRLKALGNWTLGQTFGHIAYWMTVPLDQVPKPPFIIRLIMPIMKGRFLKGPMPVGFRIPRIEGGTLGIEPRSTEDGLRLLKAAIAHARTYADVKHPVFGHMTIAQRVALQLRHAELHFSFFTM